MKLVELVEGAPFTKGSCVAACAPYKQGAAPKSAGARSEGDGLATGVEGPSTSASVHWDEVREGDVLATGVEGPSTFAHPRLQFAC